MSGASYTRTEMIISGLLCGAGAALGGIYHRPWWWLASIAAFAVAIYQLIKLCSGAGDIRTPPDPRLRGAACDFLRNAQTTGFSLVVAPFKMMEEIVRIGRHGSLIPWPDEDTLVGGADALRVARETRVKCIGCSRDYTELYADALRSRQEGTSSHTQSPDMPTIHGYCPKCHSSAAEFRYGEGDAGVGIEDFSDDEYCDEEFDEEDGFVED